MIVVAAVFLVGCHPSRGLTVSVVRDDDGSPVSGATVEVVMPYPLEPGYCRTYVTDAKGNAAARINVDTNNHIRVCADGFERGYVDVGDELRVVREVEVRLAAEPKR
jgi:hypothetical protein